MADRSPSLPGRPPPQSGSVCHQWPASSCPSFSQPAAACHLCRAAVRQPADGVFADACASRAPLLQWTHPEALCRSRTRSGWTTRSPPSWSSCAWRWRTCWSAWAASCRAWRWCAPHAPHAGQGGAGPAAVGSPRLGLGGQRLLQLHARAAAGPWSHSWRSTYCCWPTAPPCAGQARASTKQGSQRAQEEQVRLYTLPLCWRAAGASLMSGSLVAQEHQLGAGALHSGVRQQRGPAAGLEARHVHAGSLSVVRAAVPKQVLDAPVHLLVHAARTGRKCLVCAGPLC